jgi:prolyl oligopeptidase
MTTFDSTWPRRDDCVEDLHGVPVADPYRWLEDSGASDTLAWTAAQNERTRGFLDALPGRAERHARIDELLRANTVTSADVAGGRLFTVERPEGYDQAVLVIRDAACRLGEPGRVLVDPVVELASATAAVDWYRPSPDGMFVAVGLSTGGDERSEMRIVEATGRWRPDRIPGTRAASVVWARDGSGFAYTRYPNPAAVPAGEEHYWRTVWWHILGESARDDALVFSHPDDKTAWPDLSPCPDGRWLVINLTMSWNRTDVYLIDRHSGQRVTVLAGVDAVSRFGLVDGELVGVTTLDAPRGRVVRAYCSAPHPDRWETLVAESESVIQAVVSTAGSILVARARSGLAALDRYDRQNPRRLPESIGLPEPGSLISLTGSDDRDEAWFAFTSFARPPQLFRWTATDGLAAWSPMSDAIDPEQYRVHQERFESTDGTAVSILLLTSGDHVAIDPETPAVLNGYGGFSVAMSPVFSPAAVAHVDVGGLWAVTGIRGGSEEGEEWHQAGQRANKQQVFDDFVAAADWLIAEGRTSRSRLAIRGVSNGGLLVTAVLTQRPDLCRAVHAGVPLTDMLRYHRFQVGRLWVSELGDPDLPDEFAWLHAYSPYHRIVDGVSYPAVLVTTATGDARVDPAHARKFAARLQAATACGEHNPVLLRVEEEAGHGQGKPAGRLADELTDVLSFLHWQLHV